MFGGFACFARNFYGAMVQFGHAFGHAELGQLVAVGAKGIGLDDLCASFNVGLVHVKHGFGVRGIQFVDAALGSDGFVEQGTHGAVGDQDFLGQALVEIFNPHVRLARLDSI